MGNAPCLPLRDIGILAHIDAGKTSLTERLLFVSGRIRQAGDIDEGTTATDYLEVERERGITVKAAAANLEWKGIRVNLIDTPGHVDFSSEVGRSLHALDGAVVLVCAVAGVQSRTEALYRACARRGVARLAFVNKMDRRGASFDRAFGDIKRALDPAALAIQLPWGEGESFRGVVDLVEGKAYDFGGSGDEAERLSAPAVPAPIPVPAELGAAAEIARAELIEALASSDEGLLEDFVAGRESGPDRVRAALRAATIAGKAVPVLCGSAFSSASAALLLDAVAAYLPEPAAARRPSGRDPSTGAEVEPGDAFSCIVFKTVSDPSLGRLSWIRVRSGQARAGDKVLDAGAGKLVRITRVFGIQADRLEEVPEARDGDIVALALGARGREEGGVGATGATLCDPRRPLLYEPIAFEEPVVSIALEPRAREDAERLRAGAQALVDEDPSLRLSEDPQTGRIELSGMGELHLEVAAERLAGEQGARFRSGRPRVTYHEVLSGAASAREVFDRDLGGERARATVELSLGPESDPGPKRVSFAVSPSLRAGASIVEAARRGAEAGLSVGPSAGFPLEGVRAVLESVAIPGGSLSSPTKVAERAVEIAASMAAGKALREAGSRIVEPVMRIEVKVAEDFLGPVALAVSGRGGRVESIDIAADGLRSVSGAAPLRCLFGFAGELRSLSGGRAEYSARFLRFEAVPATAGIQ
jgi:elongation factor G